MNKLVTIITPCVSTTQGEVSPIVNLIYAIRAQEIEAFNTDDDLVAFAVPEYLVATLEKALDHLRKSKTVDKRDWQKNINKISDQIDRLDQLGERLDALKKHREKNEQA